MTRGLTDIEWVVALNGHNAAPVLMSLPLALFSALFRSMASCKLATILPDRRKRILAGRGNPHALRTFAKSLPPATLSTS